MQTNPCMICGRSSRSEQRTTQTPEYVIHWRGLCPTCQRTLERGLAAITTALLEAHDEQRDRFFDRMLNRLNRFGFTTGRKEIA